MTLACSHLEASSIILEMIIKFLVMASLATTAFKGAGDPPLYLYMMVMHDRVQNCLNSNLGQKRLIQCLLEIREWIHLQFPYLEVT